MHGTIPLFAPSAQGLLQQKSHNKQSVQDEPGREGGAELAKVAPPDGGGAEGGVVPGGLH